MAETIVMASGLSWSTVQKRSKELTFDVWAYSALDLEVEILAIKGDGELWVAVVLETSMNPDQETRWKPLGAFTPLPEGGQDARRFTGFLRYVRVHLSSNAETSAKVTFNLRGMAR